MTSKVVGCVVKCLCTELAALVYRTLSLQRTDEATRRTWLKCVTAWSVDLTLYKGTIATSARGLEISSCTHSLIN